MTIATGQTPTNPAGWPPELLGLFERAITVEYASLTRAGVPVTVPVTPYLGEDRRTIDVSTGLTYPVKAERARRNPRVALLFSDAHGTGLDRAPVALVQGLASVRDADLQANTDRYARLAMVKTPEAFASQPRWLLRRLSWYFARIWIEVTPTRIVWWPDGRLDETPQEWTAPEGTQAPPSDRAPHGTSARTFLEQPSDWRAEVDAALAMPMRDLTTVGSDGFPSIVPVRAIEPRPDGFQLRPAAGNGVSEGPACLTAHTHSVPFTSQQNRTFAGGVALGPDGAAGFSVERLLGDWSIPSGKLSAAVDFLGKGRHLRPRLRAEAARRGQEPPRVRLPPR